MNDGAALYSSRLISAIYICLSFLLIPQGTVAKSSEEPLAPLEFVNNGGFCYDGADTLRRWSLTDEVDGLIVWNSFCSGDSDKGSIVSRKFLAPSKLAVYVLGSPGSPGLRLALRSAESGREVELHVPRWTGSEWRMSSFEIPSEWVGKPVQIKGEDNSPTDSFGFAIPLLPLNALAADSIPTDRPQAGFCAAGVPLDTLWPPHGAASWGSYCNPAKQGINWKSSRPVAARAYLSLYVAGFPGAPGVRLAAENLATGSQLPLQIRDAPGSMWRLYHFPLPDSWRGQPVRVLAMDENAGNERWIAFSEPTSQGSYTGGAAFAFRLLALVLLLFITCALPAAAPVVLAMRRGVRDPLDLTCIGLLGIGGVGYAAFWIYFLNRTAGIIYSYFVLIVCFAICAYGWVTMAKLASWPARWRVLKPFVVVGLAAVIIICIGFLYGKPGPMQEYTGGFSYTSLGSAQDYAAHRFGPIPLWLDNYLPKLLADGIYRHRIPPPLPWGWMSSDRPPLQAGIVLWNYPWTHGAPLSYQVLGTILQLTFLAGLWAYLESSKLSSQAVSLILAVSLYSGITILNSFYVWPKLFPLAFLFVLAAYLFTNRFYMVRSSWKFGIVCGAAVAFAMLCHGGNLFALLGIGLTALLLRRLPSLRFLVAAAVTAAVLYVPWSLYQKYCDPPGDRLLRMHLAGVEGAHPEATVAGLVITGYKNLGWHGVLEFKRANFALVLGKTSAFWREWARLAEALVHGDHNRLTAAVASFRASMIFHWSVSIDLFMFAPAALLLGLALNRRNSPEFQQACKLWLCTAVVLVVWCLMMFGPGSTFVHQGSYFTEIAAFAGGILAFWTVSPRLAMVMGGIHILLNSAVFIFLRAPTPLGFATLMGPINAVLACVTAVATLALFWVLWSASGLTSPAAPRRQVSLRRAMPAVTLSFFPIWEWLVKPHKGVEIRLSC